MSSDWPVVSVDSLKASEQGSLAIGPFGSRMKSDCYVSSGVRVVRGTNLTGGRLFSGEFVHITAEKAEELNSANLQPNDLVFPHRGAIGEVGIVPKDGERYVLSSSLMKLTCAGDRAHPDFIYYFFKSDAGRFELLKNSSQVGTPGIGQPLTSLRQIKLKLPPLQEQKSISALMRSLDDRIALLRETNVTLEAIAQALFKSWFVDFDPVHAKQQGIAPAGMDEATAALFPDSFEASAMGVIPRGWRVEPISEVVEGVFDGPHATPPEADEGPVFLGIKNLTGTALDFSEVRHIAEDDFSQWTRRVTPKTGDIVFSYEATLGFFALIPSGLRCCLGRRLALIRPIANQHDGHFLFHQFVSPPFQRLLEKHTIHGATVNRIALKHFPSYTVLNPPQELKSAFDRVAAPLWARIHANQAQAQTLATLRDTLLPRLISGQLRLPLVEEAIAEVAHAN
ncbi:restriction endonuclease subunit S [Sphaerotilaceae bacterium SBD11-9]